MFFQFSPPARKPVQKVPALPAPEEVEVLSLAPFKKNPKICFDEAQVGLKTVKNLLIENPLHHDVQITVRADFGNEIGVVLSWYTHIIEKNSECNLEIMWTPMVEGSWRYMLHVSDGNKIQRDIPVTFKSICSKKSKRTKSRGKSKCLPKFKTKSPNHSAVKRKLPDGSPKKRPALPNITNIPSLTINNEENVIIGESKHGKENYNCDFTSGLPPNTLQNDIPSRRDTYIVPKVTTKSPQCSTTPILVDSLEMDSSSIKNGTTNDIAARLEGMSFNLSPVLTPQRSVIIFSPECCSTEEKTRASTSHFEKHFQSNSTFKLMENTAVGVETHNTSTETYVKGNLSTETYIKGNLSSETYVKDNISSETYVLADVSSTKDSSFTELANLQFSPWVQNKVAKGRAIRSPENVAFEASLRTYNRDMNLPLSCIQEESWLGDTFSACSSMKRKSNVTFDMTPKKRMNLGIYDWSKKGGLALGSAKKSSRLSMETRIEGVAKSLTVTNTVEVSVRDPFLFRSALAEDPFMSAFIHRDDEWMDRQQQNFKNWLNLLLTPVEFTFNEENQVDIAKIWEQCKRKEINGAPSRELIANRVHTDYKLNSLRKAAMAMFKSEEIVAVLSKVMSAVDQDKLTVRQDRDIHLDLFLQSAIMSIILNYNPLWLRLGLETIYNEIIPMNSNTNIVALSSFIFEKFFKDSRLLKKHKSIHSPRYCKDIKKFILKKFLTLVYFLDQAKMRKLIQHDPCLFRKNGHFKESREALLRFARDTLMAVGDITKYLKHFGYVVQHKQTYIDEFDYAVKILGVDLRDGIRLAKIAEIILLRSDLTRNLRVPAISRLQKIHNMKMVFDSLEAAGFQFYNDILPKDIVDGHKEKSLSFLWQIIYKFQTPLNIKSVTTIQQWWRSTPVLIKRAKLKAIYDKKNEAAKKIQSWYRRRLYIKKIEHFIKLVNLYIEDRRRQRAATAIQKCVKMFITRRKFIRLRNIIIAIQRCSRKWLISEKRTQNLAAVKIQSCFRMFIARQKFLKLKHYVLLVEERYLANKWMKIEMERYQNLKYMTICVQQRYRAIVHGRKVRTQFIRLRHATVFVQQRYRAKIQGRIERERFLCLKAAAIIMQKRYRAKREMTKQREVFLDLKAAVITIQRGFRAITMGRLERRRFVAMKEAAITIQRRYRAYRDMQKQRQEFLLLKTATIIIQTRFRALVLGRLERSRFAAMKEAAITIQRLYRVYRVMQKKRQEFIVLKTAAIIIQRRFRAITMGRLERRRFLMMKKAAITVQRRYRAYREMKKQRQHFLLLKTATITIQAHFRALVLGRLDRNRFVFMKRAAITIQRQYRAYRAMKRVRQEFIVLKTAAIIIQRRFRAITVGRLERRRFLMMKEAAITIQRRYRAYREMKKQRQHFLLLKTATITIQAHFRALVLGRLEKNRFVALKQAAIAIQRQYRAYKTMKRERQQFIALKTATLTIQRQFRAIIVGRLERYRFVAMKEAAITIQRRYRASREAKKQRQEFILLKTAVITIQRRFRAITMGRLEMRRFLMMKEAVITIQRKYRAYREMKKQRQQFLLLKTATITIQMRFRALVLVRLEKNRFMSMKAAAITIQRQYKAYRDMKKQRQEYLALKAAAVTIQTHFRATRELRQKRAEERRRQNEAATKIQAAWRGYRSRSEEHSKMIEIRRKLEEANKNALPENTLGFRCKSAVFQLNEKLTLAEIITALEDIEYVTRRCRDSCVKMSRVLSKYLYITITSTNRSPAEMKACTVAAHILINFYRCPAARPYSFVAEYLDKIITVMMHWCDKEEPLFPVLSTLIWHFCHTQEYKIAILESPNFWLKMSKIESLCKRKEKMVSKVNTNFESLFCPPRHLPLPSVIPDWGFQIPSQPKVFYNSLQALYNLLSSLRA